MTPPSVQGRVAIVTGAGRGIGQATARALLAAGWQVVVNDVDDGIEESARTMAGGAESRCVGVPGDLSDDDARQRLVSAAMAAFGRIDALVNNAGIGGADADALTLDLDDFRRVLEVNLLAPFDLARRAAARMIEGGEGGRIVNMGSVFGQQAVRNGAAYCSSKGAVTLLTQALALELGRHGITVNTVAPGYILTDMHRAEIALMAGRSGRSVGEEQEALADSVPLGRHGTAEDVAGAVLWLLGDQASYVTGQTVSVNGGIQLT